jgi:hypothetical protein
MTHDSEWRPTCALCGLRCSKRVRLNVREGEYLCSDSRACMRRHWQQMAEADLESQRWELAEPDPDADIPF